jgi:hypothetical protein
MRRLFSIDPVGILKAWTTHVRTKSARMTAMTIDSKYSRRVDFLKVAAIFLFALGPHPQRLPRLAHARRADSGTGVNAPGYSCPTFNTARKASCGISTRPTRFIRFLPSFCFSSSFRFRLMSPP